MADFCLYFDNIAGACNINTTLVNLEAIVDFLSVSFWVKIDANYLGGDLQRVLWGRGVYGGYHITSYNGHIWLRIFNNGGSVTITCMAVEPILADKWYHIVVIINRGISHGVKIYINGESVLLDNDDIFALHGEFLNLNSIMPLAGFAGGLGLKGYFDSPAFYKNYLLSQEEVTALYNDGKGVKMTGGETGLSWAANLDDGTGSIFSIVKGDGNRTLSQVGTHIFWTDGGIPLTATSREDISTQTPSTILYEYIVDILEEANRPDESGEWPIYKNYMPDDFSKCIAIYDDSGIYDGRLMSTNEEVNHYGIMIAIRGEDSNEVYVKIAGLINKLNKINKVEVEYESQTFEIQCLTQKTPITNEGLETIKRFTMLKVIFVMVIHRLVYS